MAARRDGGARFVASWRDEHGRRKHKSFSGPNAQQRAERHEEDERETTRLIKAGKTTRRDIEVAQGSRTKCSVVIDQYIDDLLRRKQCTPKYAREQRRLVNRVLAACPAEHIGGVTTEDIRSFLDGMLDDACTNRNSNGHLSAMVGLFKFARRHRFVRAADDPTLDIEALPEPLGGEGVLVERPFTVDEYQRLINDERVRASGRALYYRALFQTLLRGEELIKILRRDVQTLTRRDARDRERDITYIDVRADVAKSGMPRLVPLAPSLAADLMRVCAARRADDRLFPAKVTRRAFYRDLQRAGIEQSMPNGNLYLKAMRTTGSIWLRDVGATLADEMLIAGAKGRKRERTRVWHYNHLQTELPRLYGRIVRLAEHCDGRGAKVRSA